MIGPATVDSGAGLAIVEPTSQRRAESYWRESAKRLLSNRIGVFCGGVVLALAVVAISAPLLSTYATHYDPARQVLADTFLPPSRTHPLGTDELGRDTLTRLLYGARVSLLVAFVTVSLLILVGGFVGMVAGFYGGIIDQVLMRIVDVILSVPSIYLLILLTILQPKIGPFKMDPSNPVSLAVIIAIVGWGGLARLVRGEVLTVKERDFMLATRAMGATGMRLIFLHLLPNVASVMIVAASLAVGGVILTEAALDFIGLGIQPPTASWGNMLANSQVYFYHSIWLVVFPGLCIFVTVLCMNIFGNAIRDAFDPRLK